MKSLLLATALGLAPVDDGPAPTIPVETPRPRVVVVVGAPGTPEYQASFRAWADRWKVIADRGPASLTLIGLDDPPLGPDGKPVDDRGRLQSTLQALAAPPGPGPGQAAPPTWLVLIGHGSFDGKEAKFNLRGPDVADAELAAWLAAVPGPLAVVDCSSASGPFLNRLSGPNRVVVTATKSGQEQNYARFGEHFAEALAGLAADLDKDGQVSLLEAFLTASRRAEEFYRSKQRLSTEHALIDDNGDARGTPAAWFQGVRATQKARDGSTLDGLRAHQMHLIPSDQGPRPDPATQARRDELEVQVANLRDRKVSLGEEEYYRQLEPILIDLAKTYQEKTK